MMIRLQFGMAFLLALSSATLMGQEIAYLDLVDVKPRTEFRSPPSPPPVCNEDGSCTVSGGSFGSVSCGAEARGEPRALKATLVSLDRFAYAPDDAAEMEIRIENVGSVDMSVPLNPHLADLQPADERRSFRYSSFAIILKLARHGDSNQHEIIEAAKLYGATEKPASLMLLKPGESLRLRVKTKLAISSEKLKGDADYWASVIPELRSEIFAPNVKNGGYSTDIANDYPRRLSGPDLMLRITGKSETRAEVPRK
jgi:hypothetical protein